LYNNDEPTPEDLFGLLGIFPTFCESKIGQKFTKCLTKPPVSAPVSQMMSGGKGAPTGGSMMGKRERRRTTTFEELYSKDILTAFNALTSDEKKRLLLAIEQDDVKMIDAIFDTVSDEDHYHHIERNLHLSNNNNNDEPTPEDLFGLLGIFPTFCESKFGQKFTKCLTNPPVTAPVSQMMSGGKGTMMGKRERRMVQEVYYYDSNDLLEAYNALSSNDKKRLILAIEHDNVEAIDEILLLLDTI
jgi:hypothetical protein